MEIIYTELALYSNKNECGRTDTVFLPISEVCNGTVSLYKSDGYKKTFDDSSDSNVGWGQHDRVSHAMIEKVSWKGDGV